MHGELGQPLHEDIVKAGLTLEFDHFVARKALWTAFDPVQQCVEVDLDDRTQQLECTRTVVWPGLLEHLDEWRFGIRLDNTECGPALQI